MPSLDERHGRRVSLAAVALPLLLSLALVGQVAVPVAEREGLPLVLLSPSGQPVQTSGSLLLQAVSEAVEPNTRYRIRVLEGEEIGACRGRLSCLSRIGLREVPKASRILVVSLLAGPNGDIASVLLLNLERTRGALLPGRAPQEGSDQAVELDLSETALAWPREGMAPVTNEQELRGLLNDAVQQAFRRSFERAGAWQVYGRLEIASPVAGLSVALDGRPVGMTVAGILRLENVEAGTRRLAFEAGGYAPILHTVVVSPGYTQTVALEPEKVSDPSGPRAFTIFAGALSATAGLGFLALAELADPRPASAREGYLHFGFVSTGRDGEGPAIVPLGLALLTAGATWALGTWLYGDTKDLPVGQWLLGSVLGAALYAGFILSEGS